MPNKTVYLRNNEVPTWEQAKRIAGLKNENISDIITTALKQYVVTNKPTADKIEKLLNGVKRSPGYENMSAQEQWEEDKRLGILDWDGK